MTGGIHTEARETRDRRLATAVAVGVILVDAIATAFTVHAAPYVPDGGSRWFGVLIVPMTFIGPVVGLLILRRYPRHVVGWLLVLHGLLVAPVLSGDIYAEYAALVKRGTWPAAGWVAAITDSAWPLLFTCLALIGYVFPDGRFLSVRWRRFAITCLALQVAFIIASVLTLRHLEGALRAVSVPFTPLPEAPFWPVVIAGLLSLPVFLIGAVVSLRKRFKQAAGAERLKMLWVAGAAVTIPGGLTACWLDVALGGTNGGTLTLIGVAVFGTVLPLAIGIAILRHQLFDIELVLSRTLTYGVLTALVIGMYAGLLAMFNVVFDNHTAAGILAVGLLAVAIEPVHTRVRRRVERLVYGDRSDPYAAIRRLSQRVEGLAEPGEVVNAVTASIAEALRVEIVTVELDAGDAVPAAVPNAHRVPLVHHGQRLGDLVVGVPPKRVLSAADLEMLDELARHAATVVNAVHLTLELQQSRARLVNAREEERRRLRRDLHDGVGPSLAAMVLKLNALGATIDNPVADELIIQLRNETKDAIAEIRRLVDDLRPPALDEVGLVASLRQKATALSEAPLLIEVDGPAHLPPLPAAAEVAAYRIALEAMTNVARHARASRCVVTVTVNGALEVTVADNGIGIPAEVAAHVGIGSMHERAAELSGSCSITQRGEGGTVVRAVIPIPVTSTIDLVRAGE